MNYKFDHDNHVHSLDGKPLTGTSSIGNVLAKPALIQWAANMAVQYIESKLPDSKLFTVTKDEMSEWLKEAKFAHKKKKESAAVKGTDLHEMLEKFVKSEMGKWNYKDDEFEAIKPYMDWSRANVKEYLASEAHCYEEELWVGGITDCVAELNDGTLAVIDFKSSKEAYITHFIQVAGYAIQIEKNGMFSEDGEHSKKLEGKIGALVIVPFGAKEIVPTIRYSVEDYKTGFRQAVGLYRLMGMDAQK